MDLFDTTVRNRAIAELLEIVGPFLGERSKAVKRKHANALMLEILKEVGA